jgi:dienelactone hydrolase
MASEAGPFEVAEEPLEYRVGDTRLAGWLAAPAGAPDGADVADLRPAVLVFPEWWGVTAYPRHRARQLAAQGYVALAADMYGEGYTTKDAAEASQLAGQTRLSALGRERSAAALEALRADERVDGGRVATIGFCFGGDVALELARSGAEVRCAVAFHASLTTTSPAAPDGLHARVLALHGADDPIVPPEQVQAFQDEMRAARADWQLVAYGNAVHSFSNPDADAAGIEGVAYDEATARRSWALGLAFLDEVLLEEASTS